MVRFATGESRKGDEIEYQGPYKGDIFHLALERGIEKIREKSEFEDGKAGIDIKLIDVVFMQKKEGTFCDQRPNTIQKYYQ